VRYSLIFAYFLLFPNPTPKLKLLDLVSVQCRDFYVKFSFPLTPISIPETI
jgi:hypothetical protein